MLEQILAEKRQEVSRKREAIPFDRLRAQLPEDPVLRLSVALAQKRLNVIAEIKYRSPSHGPFFCQAPPETIARGYRDNGAAALSILTDEQFFGGSLEYLARVRKALAENHVPDEPAASGDASGQDRLVNPLVPLLRKDFILDRYQVMEARCNGASAFLLIVACLTAEQLSSLRLFGEELGLEALVEVHDPFELETAVESGARLIGVNNRNLRTFEVDLRTSFEMARRIEGEAGIQLVAESGLSTRTQMEELREAGFCGFLIGTSFMKTEDPGFALGKMLRE